MPRRGAFFSAADRYRLKQIASARLSAVPGVRRVLGVHNRCNSILMGRKFTFLPVVGQVHGRRMPHVRAIY